MRDRALSQRSGLTSNGHHPHRTPSLRGTSCEVEASQSNRRSRGPCPTLRAHSQPSLGPPHGPYGKAEDPKLFRDRIRSFFAAKARPGHDVLVLVGHEPALGWLLDGWTASPLPPPLASAEMVCLVRPSHTDDVKRWDDRPLRASQPDQSRPRLQRDGRALQAVSRAHRPMRRATGLVRRPRPRQLRDRHNRSRCHRMRWTVRISDRRQRH
jgi:hypothetical protein